MKKSNYFVSALLLTLARLIIIACCFVFSFLLYRKVNPLFVFAVYSVFRFLLLFPPELFRFHGGSLGAFRAFSNSRLYFRSILALLIRLVLYAVVLLPLSAILLVFVVGFDYLPLCILFGLVFTFVFWLLYQRTFAVPLLLSNGFSVLSAYRFSMKLTKGKIGECAMFYVKRLPMLILRPTVFGWILVAPFYYSQKSKLVENMQF